MTLEQDKRAAELLGWHKGTSTSAISPMPGRELPWYWYDADGRQCAPCITDAFANMYPFAPSTSHDDARVLEDAIERLHLMAAYVTALGDVVPHQRSYSGSAVIYPPMAVWAFMRATPAQRTTAFIATMEGL